MIAYTVVEYLARVDKSERIKGFLQAQIMEISLDVVEFVSINSIALV